MSEGQPLRFYGNPLKFLLLLLASAIFVAIGIWMLRTPTTSAIPSNVVIAWLAIGFLGWVMVFLIGFIHDVVLRRAVLEIDEQGWSYRHNSKPLMRCGSGHIAESRGARKPDEQTPCRSVSASPSDTKSARAIEPAMEPLDDPAPRALEGSRLRA